MMILVSSSTFFLALPNVPSCEDHMLAIVCELVGLMADLFRTLFLAIFRALLSLLFLSNSMIRRS